MSQPPLQYSLQGRRMTRCQADDDDYCDFAECPQMRDGEPHKSGRHCPLDREEDGTCESTSTARN